MPSLSTIKVERWARLLLTLKKARFSNVQKSLVAKYTWMGIWMETPANFFVFTGISCFGLLYLVHIFSHCLPDFNRGDWKCDYPPWHLSLIWTRLDESEVCGQDLLRVRQRSKHQTRTVRNVPKMCRTRFSVIPEIGYHCLVGLKIVEGTVNRKIFESFLKHRVVRA